MIALKEVTSPKELSTYISLPKELYKDYKNWVPPLLGDEKKFHSPKHNEALQYSDIIRYIAYKDSIPVGRIMGIINKRYNREHKETTARFYNLDCINDREISKVLIAAIEKWALQKGMDKIIGPFGFSDKDPQGLKIEGFENLAVILTPSNPPYLQQLVENEGYSKELDCLSYELKIPEQLPESYLKICNRIRNRGVYTLKEFSTRKQLKPYIMPVLQLVNETYGSIFGFVPLSEIEIKNLAAQYLPLLEPDLVKLVVDKEQLPVGFVVSMPGMTEGLQKSGGKLFPFGFLHILKAMKRTRQLVLLLGAVKPGKRGVGVTALLAEALMGDARKRKMTVIDTHVILESNYLMRAEVENLGGTIYKRFRVYQKKLECYEF